MMFNSCCFVVALVVEFIFSIEMTNLLSSDVSTPKARTHASAAVTTASTTNRRNVVDKIIPRSAKKTRLDVPLTARVEI